jgi:acylphosphatase
LRRTAIETGERRRVHVFVAGRVQGVAFRRYLVRRAAHLGLWGWVRNLFDGRVEYVAEGPAAAVAALLEWTRRGPPAARVDGVEVAEEAVLGREGPFESRPTASP